MKNDDFVLQSTMKNDDFILQSTVKNDFILQSAVKNDNFILQSTVKNDDFVLQRTVKNDDFVLQSTRTGCSQCAGGCCWAGPCITSLSGACPECCTFITTFLPTSSAPCFVVSWCHVLWSVDVMFCGWLMPCSVAS